MKKLLFILCLAISMAANAQISLEHTYVSTSISTDFFSIDSDIYYFTYSAKKLKVYKSDHSLHKEITISLDAGYSITDILFPSNKLFNTDELIEFIIRAHNVDMNQYSMKLFNENNVLIHDFGERSTAWLASDGESAKLLIGTSEYSFSTKLTTYTTDIYQLPGTVSSKSIAINSAERSNPPYPVPAANYINIPYTLEPGEQSVIRIYNTGGRLMEQRDMDFSFNNLLIDVDSYQSGVYVYEYNGISGRFIVK